MYVSSIILNSLPSRPGAYISKTSVVGLVQRDVMREVTGPFLIGSLYVPVNVHAFFASHVPSLIIMPVDMLSIHVAQYLPVTLSYPLMPWPVNGMPIIEPLNSSTSTRPSSTMVRVALPVSSLAGAAGASHTEAVRTNCAQLATRRAVTGSRSSR